MADFSLAGTGDTYADLLLLGGAESEAVVPQEEAPEMMSTHVRNKPGRHPLYEVYPEIVTHTVTFIKLHGFSAQSRQRSTVGNAMGVSLEDVRQHLLNKLLELCKRGISKTTVHSLFCSSKERNTECPALCEVDSSEGTREGQQHSPSQCRQSLHICTGEVLS